MERRDFILRLSSAAFAWSLPAHAQQQSGRTKHVAVLMNLAERDPMSNPRVKAIEDGLAQLGWTQERNLRIDYRWAGGDSNLIRAYAVELVASGPAAIIANGTPAAKALQTETHIIPVVFNHVADPVGVGLVKNLAQPEGNITGFSFFFDPPMYGKWLEFLKEVAPNCDRVAVMINPGADIHDSQLPTLRAAAASLAFSDLIELPVSSPVEVEERCSEIAAKGNIGLIVQPSPFSGAYREAIVSAINRHKICAVYPFRYFAAAGGLLSYGPDVLDPFRGTALYTGRILNGEKIADLPVQQATKFEFVINAKTAKALGIAVPPTLLARADEVIE
jgi:putative tryptophan/tyrosine transport system substrate-binding protein